MLNILVIDLVFWWPGDTGPDQAEGRGQAFVDVDLHAVNRNHLLGGVPGFGAGTSHRDAKDFRLSLYVLRHRHRQ